MSARIPLPLGPAETGRALAERLRLLRLLKGWTRETMAKRSAVSAASLKRFENTGMASLELVLKTAYALARLDEFSGLFQPPTARTLAELEQCAALPVRKRGRV
ncbi:MAG: XRE family transcriptional regulator [Elusimicrobia bacterium]|nr:XRE family transcriptional regulator [Elusimicrobiota bacterium]